MSLEVALINDDNRQIIHIDMDAFYASVEQRDFPELKGKPIIVGGKSKDRGVVATASYEARKFGIKSAMPTAKAFKLCPSLIQQETRFEVYKQVSETIRSIFEQYTKLIEPLSLDEAFLDVTNHELSASQIAMEIREKIYQKTKLTASAGVGPSKLIAKIASDIRKPNGLTVVPAEKVFAFMQPLPLKRIPGIGPVSAKSLNNQGYIFCHDISSEDIAILENKFGEKRAHWLKRKASGLDNSSISQRSERKSIGHERTYNEDVISLDTINTSLSHLVDRGIERLKKSNMTTKTVTLKVKYHDFSVSNRSLTVEHPSANKELIMEALDILVRKTKLGKKPIRLLGVSFSNLSSYKKGTGPHMQRPLFPMETK